MAAKKYEYYICTGHKREKNGCKAHNIRRDALEQAVLATVQAHIRLAIDIDRAMQQVNALDWEQREVRKLNARIEALNRISKNTTSLNAISMRI